MRKVISVVLVCLAISACSDEPRPPFFNDYGACVKSHQQLAVWPSSDGKGVAYVPQTFCDAYQYPDGDGPIFRREFDQYKKDHAIWWRAQLNQSHPPIPHHKDAGHDQRTSTNHDVQRPAGSRD